MKFTKIKTIHKNRTLGKKPRQTTEYIECNLGEVTDVLCNIIYLGYFDFS